MSLPSAGDTIMCYTGDAYCEETIVLLLILSQLISQPALQA